MSGALRQPLQKCARATPGSVCPATLSPSRTQLVGLAMQACPADLVPAWAWTAVPPPFVPPARCRGGSSGKRPRAPPPEAERPAAPPSPPPPPTPSLPVKLHRGPNTLDPKPRPKLKPKPKPKPAAAAAAAAATVGAPQPPSATVLPAVWISKAGWRTQDGAAVPWLAPAAATWAVPELEPAEPPEGYFVPPPPPEVVLRPLPFLEVVDWNRCCGVGADGGAVMAVGHAATRAVATAALAGDPGHILDASGHTAAAFHVPPLLVEMPAVVVQASAAEAPAVACRLACTPGVQVVTRCPGFALRVITTRLRRASDDPATKAFAAVVGRAAAGAATLYHARPGTVVTWDMVAAAVAERSGAKPLQPPDFPPKPSRAVLAIGGALFYWAAVHPDARTLPAPRALLYRALEDLTLRHGVLWRAHRPEARRLAGRRAC